MGNGPTNGTDPIGLWEKPPYIGPSLDILYTHKAAGNLEYQVQTVSARELDALHRDGLVSPYAYREAQDLLPSHSRVQVAVSPRLRKGINAIEASARIGGAVKAVGGVIEAGEGVILIIPTLGGSSVMILHGLDHTQSGLRSFATGIDQDTIVSIGAQYGGRHALGLSDEGARSLGRLTELSSDILLPVATARIARLRMLNQEVSFAGSLDSSIDDAIQGSLHRAATDKAISELYSSTNGTSIDFSFMKNVDAVQADAAIGVMYELTIKYADGTIT